MCSLHETKVLPQPLSFWLKKKCAAHLTDFLLSFFFLFFFSVCLLTKSRLDNHLILCHNYKKDDYRCESCSQGFSHRPSLLRHRALRHGEVRRFPCENCSKVSANELVFLPLFLLNWLRFFEFFIPFIEWYVQKKKSVQISQFNALQISVFIQNTEIIYSKYQSTEGDNNQILISCLWACMFLNILSCIWFGQKKSILTWSPQQKNKKKCFTWIDFVCGNLGQMPQRSKTRT